MKYLVVGLGNPGAQYHLNRHNIGFLVLNELAGAKGKEFGQDRHGYTVTVKHKGRTLILLKPTTYMNLSGKAVRFHLEKHKIPVSNLLVITDDLSIPFGKLRLRAQGSAGGHNGLKNIQEILGGKNWARLRFGVGNDFPKGRQVDYVLEDFPQEEMDALPPLIDRSIEVIQSFASIGVERTMNFFN